MESKELQPLYSRIDFEKYISVYGASINKTYSFVAVKFKIPVIPYDRCIFIPDNNPIATTDKQIYVISPTAATYVVCNQTHLIYRLKHRENDGSIYVPNSTFETLLTAIFPEDSLIFHVMQYNTLYVLTTLNPFSSFMKRNRRDYAFRALWTLCQSAMKNKFEVNLEKIALIKHFHRNKDNPSTFNTWSKLAFFLTEKPLKFNFNLEPSASLGHYISICLDNLKIIPDNFPPPEFYTCEILLTDENPTGIAFSVVQDYNHERKICKYVSPMIVSFQTQRYMDSNRVVCHLSEPSEANSVCRCWMPLFKNHQTWMNYGMNFFLKQRGYMFMLDLVLSWLYKQTSEKYNHMYMDLRYVFQILCGSNDSEKIRWPLKHLSKLSSNTTEIPMITSHTV